MRAKDIGYIGLLIFAVLCFLLALLMYSAPAYESTIIQIDNASPCKKNNGEWIQVADFIANESVYICGYVRANIQELHQQIQIRIYEGERDLLKQPIYYDNIWVSNGEMHIPLKIYLDPDNYTVEISIGRKILNVIQLQIKN